MLTLCWQLVEHYHEDPDGLCCKLTRNIAAQAR